MMVSYIVLINNPLSLNLVINNRKTIFVIIMFSPYIDFFFAKLHYFITRLSLMYSRNKSSKLFLTWDGTSEISIWEEGGRGKTRMKYFLL